MKRGFTIILLLVFLMGTIGLDVRAHYCGGELLEMSVNGLPINASTDHDMPCCMHGDGCQSCKVVFNSYKVQSQYRAGQGVLIQPAMASPDWLHGGMTSLALIHFTSWFPATVGRDRPEFIYTARNRLIFHYPQGGLRAPPVA